MRRLTVCATVAIAGDERIVGQLNGVAEAPAATCTVGGFGVEHKAVMLKVKIEAVVFLPTENCPETKRRYQSPYGKGQEESAVPEAQDCRIHFTVVSEITDLAPTRPKENAHFGEGAAQGAAVGAENAPIDPDLQKVIERWPDLPDAVNVGMLAMVRASAESA